VAVLHAIEGPLAGRTFGIPKKQKVIVGRYEIYDLIVPDPSISRKHFILEKRPDGVYLIDQGSLNGTLLNGLRVSTAKLTQGDRITAGQTVLAYDETDSPTPPPPPSAGGAGPAVEEEPIEVLSDEDIEEAPEPIEEPPEPVEEPPSPAPTIPMNVQRPPSKRAGSAIGNRTTERLVPKGGQVKLPASAEVAKCAACGRGIAAEELKGGECAKTRLGYVCGRCIERRQKSGHKGSLEQFVRERQRRQR